MRSKIQREEERRETNKCLEMIKKSTSCSPLRTKQKQVPVKPLIRVETMEDSLDDLDSVMRHPTYHDNDNGDNL
jgi:hypothetical protein